MLRDETEFDVVLCGGVARARRAVLPSRSFITQSKDVTEIAAVLTYIFNMSARYLRKLREIENEKRKEIESEEIESEDDVNDVAAETETSARKSFGFHLLAISSSEDEDDVPENLEEQRLRSESDVSDSGSKRSKAGRPETGKEQTRRDLNHAAERREISKNRKKKKRKRRKKRGRKCRNDKTDRLTASEIDKLTDLSTVNATSTDGHAKETSTGKVGWDSLLRVCRRRLREDNEIKKKFGTANMSSDQNIQVKRKHRKRGLRSGSRRGVSALDGRRLVLVTPDPSWPTPPTLLGGGIGMEMVSTLSSSRDEKYFRFIYSSEYKEAHEHFVTMSQISHDPQTLIALVQRMPLHTTGLLMLSDFMRQLGRKEDAAKLIRRCVYVYQCALHPTFNFPALSSNGHRNDARKDERKKVSVRLPYTSLENQNFFKVVFRHMLFVLRRGCPRTALEFGKMLLSLDVSTDPMGILLCIDAIALYCREHEWLLSFVKAFDEPRGVLLGVPGIHFARALALAMRNGFGSADATQALRCAIETFPFVLCPLVRAAKLVDNGSARCERWKTLTSHSCWEAPVTHIGSKLAAIMAEMQKDLWSAPKSSDWLYDVASSVVDSAFSECKGEVWRDSRAFIEATYDASTSIYRRYESRTPWEYSEKGGSLEGAMLANAPQAMQEQSTGDRTPMELDGNTNPLLLFMQTLMPWNHVSEASLQNATVRQSDESESTKDDDETGEGEDASQGNSTGMMDDL